MRNRDDILKSFIDMGGLGGRMMRTDARGNLFNPKLQLEVLLDIRELLIEIKEKIEQSRQN